jgi:hypothetical protein
LDSNIREGVKDLYTKFILSRENSTTDLSLYQLKTHHHQLFKEFFEFRLIVEKLIGPQKLTQLFGSEAEMVFFY